jgi:hypothetical protein
MKIYTVNATLLAQGRAVFEAGLRCGPERGLAVVPGAILAAIENGLTTHSEIERAVAFHSRCRRSTVATVLAALSTERNPNGLWARDADGCYRCTQQDGEPFSIVAA